jgi:hypothetical protein
MVRVALLARAVSFAGLVAALALQTESPHHHQLEP